MEGEVYRQPEQKSSRNKYALVSIVAVAVLITAYGGYVLFSSNNKMQNDLQNIADLSDEIIDNINNTNPESNGNSETPKNTIVEVGEMIEDIEIEVDKEFVQQLSLKNKGRYVISVAFDEPVWYALYDTLRYESYQNGKRGMARATSGSAMVIQHSQKFDVNKDEDETWWLVIEAEETSKGVVQIYHVANL